MGIWNSIGNAAIPLCALVALIVSGCGGGDSGGAAQPLTTESLYSFGSSSTDGLGPDGEIFQGSDGNFYGTTTGGGIGAGRGSKGQIYGSGTVFKITPMGTETILHLFAGSPADGAGPGSLIQGSDGNLYGTTAEGGENNNRGTVFRLTPEGVETILYSFAPSDGSTPDRLIQGADGNFYGIALNSAFYGMVFELTPEGILTSVHTFTGGTDGATPLGFLIQGSDGNLYGTTSAGGTNDQGTVFKLTPGGVETILHSFSGPPADGAQPQNARLFQDTDGNLYGTTSLGGTNNWGTVFKLTPEGVETILHSFDGDHGDGYWPWAGLTRGTDGNLYGTTSQGGTKDLGTIFQITPEGTYALLYSFKGGRGDGSQPLSNLVQASDGNLYGTSSSGGANEDGNFFRFILN